MGEAKAGAQSGTTAVSMVGPLWWIGWFIVDCA